MTETLKMDYIDFSWVQSDARRLLRACTPNGGVDTSVIIWIERGDALNEPFVLRCDSPRIERSFFSVCEAEDAGRMLYIDLMLFR